jgi:hypothetical protein
VRSSWVIEAGLLPFPLQEPFWRGGDSMSKFRMTIQDTPGIPLEPVDNSRILLKAMFIWTSRRTRDFHQPRKVATFALYERFPICIGCFSGIWLFLSFSRQEREAEGDSARQARGTPARNMRTRPWPGSPYNKGCSKPFLSGQYPHSAARSAIHREQLSFVI